MICHVDHASQSADVWNKFLEDPGPMVVGVVQGVSCRLQYHVVWVCKYRRRVLKPGVCAYLLAGLFLSNYPEALASSLGMRQQGLSFSRILFMWSSLMVFTGFGAVLGSLFFGGLPVPVFSAMQGVAAGAMLTMIAETMLPEAYSKGGSVVGLSTLFGFLAAIFSRTLE
ncbi:ZIP family metal transporter [Nitrosococcus wardiae]|uniref:ZIP family metal transporter n=1 Tax=Nitrosococcus wardiae TaxID=1814290 RepID=A0A4P7C3F1_9GAMM|nr:hypothetical protein [Nitrosococcus wardiae]QBQ55446.1 hypothetical protein E3U44_13725 [Nitrosococcus wardiae]